MLRKMVDEPLLVPGKKWRGTQKINWKDSCKSDVETLALKMEDVNKKVKVVFI